MNRLLTLTLILFVSFSSIAQIKNETAALNKAFNIIQNPDLKNKAEALTLINSVISKSPENATAICYRGLYKALVNNDPRSAIADYSKAIALNPKLGIAYKGRGIMRDNLHDYKGAIQDYNIAVKLSPDMVLYHYRGSAKMMINQIEGACKDFLKSCELGFEYGCSDYKKACAKQVIFKNSQYLIR